ncbi:MAG: hypothetical protein NUV57_01000 [archaeon]|nr:hypothetical protein [archaeon]
MTAAEQDFVEYVQKYPECYAIAQSEVFMKFLKLISESPRSISELLTNIPNIEDLDLRLIVLALESAKLIKKSANIQSEVYYLTNKGETLLTKYKTAKKGL